MRGIITNEFEILEQIQRGNFDEAHVKKQIRVLCKQLLNQGLTTQEVEREVINYIKINISYFSASYWLKAVPMIIRNVRRLNSYELYKIDSITITKAEWNKIVALEDKKLEKIMFILLVYAKIQNKKAKLGYLKRGIWFEPMPTHIIKEAGVGHDDCANINKYLFKLSKLGYISFTSDIRNNNLKVNIINNNSEAMFEIADLDNVITYYDEYRNGTKYTTCQCCGKRIKRGNTRPKKYCEKCKITIDKEKHALRQKKYMQKTK